MEVIKKKLRVGNDDYYKTHLGIVNALLPVKMTTKEIEVVAAFMALDASVVEDDRFNTLARKKVKDKLKLSPGGLSNYLKALIEKGLLNKSSVTGKITIHEALIAEDEKQGYMLQLIKTK